MKKESVTFVLPSGKYCYLADKPMKKYHEFFYEKDCVDTEYKLGDHVPVPDGVHWGSEIGIGTGDYWIVIKDGHFIDWSGCSYDIDNAPGVTMETDRQDVADSLGIILERG